VAETNDNLWAPWRLEYIRELREDDADAGCFLCRYWEAPGNDEANRVVLRGRTGMIVMNRFPYTNGHLMVACGAHKGGYDKLDDAELLELNALTRDGLRLLSECIRPQGFNVGVNIGRCAGAGLPGHLHVHIVPRWNGDTNYMAVVGDVRIIPQSIEALYADLQSCATRLGLTSGR